MDESNKLFNTNVPNYPKEVRVFGVKSPHINRSNVPVRRNFNSRNVPSFNRHRYAEACVDERYRHGVYPLSVLSAFDMPQNCRPGSPLPMGSTESTVSAITAEISLAFHKADFDIEFKNAEFNMIDYDAIKVIYNKFMRKRAHDLAKKRSLKILDKQCGTDHNVNDFSISDTDDESQRRNNHNIAPSNRLTISPCARPNVQEKNIDTTNNHNPSTFGNISSIPLGNGKTLNMTQQPQINDHLTSIHPEFENISKKSNKAAVNNSHVDNSTGSDQEQCLANGSPESNISGNKRKHDDVDAVGMSKMKKIKPSTKHSNTNTSTRSDFNFGKPKLPVRKFTNTKKNERTLISSTLLSKSVTDEELQQSKDTQPHEDPLNDNELENNESSVDLSTKPSFMRTKVTTQKLGLAEKENLSTGQSPQIEQRRKGRTKPSKCTRTQLCLTSLDSNKENSHSNDLIQQIGPADDSIINKTKATDTIKANIIQRASRRRRQNKSGKNAEDVAAIISTRDVDEASDTYTDEEIFYVNKNAAPAPTGSEKQNCIRPVSKNTVIVLTSTEISENCLVSENTTKDNVAPKRMVTRLKQNDFNTDTERDREASPKTLFNNNPKTVDAKEMTLSTMSNDCEEVTNEKTEQNGDNMSNMTSNLLKSPTLRLEQINELEFKFEFECLPKRMLCNDEESKPHDKGPSPNIGSDAKIKKQEMKTKAGTSKKNAPITCASTLDDSDSVDLVYQPKQRTRSRNVSNSSTQNEIGVRKEKRVDTEKDPNNTNKNQNAGSNKAKGKARTNRTLLTSSVQTRRAKALSVALDVKK